MTASFFKLPPELRLLIYAIYLANHTQVLQRRQPSNQHLRLLRVCSTIHCEARDLLQGYVSLRNEREILSFLRRATPRYAACVRWTDVAHDARVLQESIEVMHVAQLRIRRLIAVIRQTTMRITPASQVGSALKRMSSLRTLRVFDCVQAVRISLNSECLPKAPAKVLHIDRIGNAHKHRL